MRSRRPLLVHAARRAGPGAWLLGLLGLLSLLLAARPAAATEYQPLPPTWASGLSDDWLLHDAARNRLILYLPGYHVPAHTYYQWLRLRPGQPFPLTFAAQPGLSLFINNQLIFTAPAAATYSLDLARLLPRSRPAAAGSLLLVVWQPEGSPLLSSFTSGRAPAAAVAGRAAGPKCVPGLRTAAGPGLRRRARHLPPRPEPHLPG